MKISRKEHLAYLAGLVDGEGTITIQRSVFKGTPRFQPKLLVVNTDFALIARCKEIVGAGCVYRSKLPDNENWNPVHRYQLVAQQARLAIEAIRPYLVAKAEHADVLLGMPTRSKNHLDRTALPAQEEAWQRITLLNRRGRQAEYLYTQANTGS